MESKYRDFFYQLKLRFFAGLIDYNTAKKEAEPYINEMNDTAAKIAKKHGKKPIKFNFAGLMR